MGISSTFQKMPMATPSKNPEQNAKKQEAKKKQKIEKTHSWTYPLKNTSSRRLDFALFSPRRGHAEGAKKSVARRRRRFFSNAFSHCETHVRKFAIESTADNFSESARRSCSASVRRNSVVQNQTCKKYCIKRLARASKMHTQSATPTSARGSPLGDKFRCTDSTSKGPSQYARLATHPRPASFFLSKKNVLVCQKKCSRRATFFTSTTSFFCVSPMI